MAEQSGFMAIQPTVPQGPYARRKIVRGPDGTPQVVLVDMQGNPVNDPSAYGIIEAGNYYDGQGLQTATIKTSDPKPESEKSTAKAVISDNTRAEGGRGGDPTPGSGNFGRSQANNFGYVNKPGLLGMAGLVPGPVGMAGKAVNVGINANNVAAVNAARGMMGLEGVGLGGAIKGAVKDNKGQVADVTFGNSQYATPVGLEALSPTGMTNMTPAEAAARARAVGSIQMATPEQVQARDDAFNAEFGKPGLLSRMNNVATSFLDNMFGTPSATPDYAAAAAQSARQGFKPSKTGFADMLGAEGGRSVGQKGPSYTAGVGKGATSVPGSPVSGASRSTAGKTSTGRGLSSKASSDIDAGRGGLF